MGSTAWSTHRVIKGPGLYRQAPPRGARQLGETSSPREDVVLKDPNSRPLHRVKQERPWGCDWVYQLAPPRGALQPEKTRFTAWSRLGLHRVIKCPGLYRQAPPRGALQLTRDLNPRPHRVGHFNWARAPPRGAHRPGISSPRGDERTWRVLYNWHRWLNAKAQSFKSQVRVLRRVKGEAKSCGDLPNKRPIPKMYMEILFE